MRTTYFLLMEKHPLAGSSYPARRWERDVKLTGFPTNIFADDGACHDHPLLLSPCCCHFLCSVVCNNAVLPVSPSFEFFPRKTNDDVMFAVPSPTMHLTYNHRPCTTPIIHLFSIWGLFPNFDIGFSRKSGPRNVTICCHASQRFPPILMVRVYPGKDCVFLNTGFPIQSPRQITGKIDFQYLFPQGYMICASFFHDFTPWVCAFLLALHWQLMFPIPIWVGT